MLESFFFNDLGKPRLGITTPRKSGKAVERNRVKRIMREYYRCNKDLFPREGALLFKLKKCCEREQLITEMLNLTREVAREASVTEIQRD